MPGSAGEPPGRADWILPGRERFSVATCKTCGARLEGRKWVFCSRRCKAVDTNNRHQSYRQQQERGRQRKLFLIRSMGGACRRCGYGGNHAAMAFHHKVPALKSFQLDLRNISNRTWQRVLDEAAKCELLCCNCHCELHHPECSITPEHIGSATSARLRRRYHRKAALDAQA